MAWRVASIRAYPGAGSSGSAHSRNFSIKFSSVSGYWNPVMSGRKLS